MNAAERFDDRDSRITDSASAARPQCRIPVSYEVHVYSSIL